MPPGQGLGIVRVQAEVRVAPSLLLGQAGEVGSAPAERGPSAAATSAAALASAIGDMKKKTE